jgi:AAA+ ATPase superfamily predicted ATPase
MPYYIMYSYIMFLYICIKPINVMQSPFLFGRIAKGKSFIDRKNELKQLTGNFSSGINTMIVAPKRWGKTSLVLKAAAQVSESKKKTRICYLDLYKIQDEEDFFESFAQEVLKASSNNWQDWVSTAKDLLKGIASSVSIGADPAHDFRLKISWENRKKEEKAILELPEKIAREKKIKFVICIDEFQKIAEFSNSRIFQQRLNSQWQDQRHTCYCLIGSNRPIITTLFTSQSQPFYRFGDLILLQKIKEKHWFGFIESQFIATGKTISKDIICRIIEITMNHPYHIQQFTHHLWRLTEQDADSKTFEMALDELLINNEILFEREIENLTPLQVRYMTAIVNREPHLNSMKTIHTYKLGSPGNLSTIKNALETKGTIDFYESTPTFINPLFEYWLRNIHLSSQKI